MKNTLLIILLFCVVVPSVAQKHGQWTTLFSSNNVSKTYVDGKAVRNFNYHNPDLGRGSLGVAYGFAGDQHGVVEQPYSAK